MARRHWIVLVEGISALLFVFFMLSAATLFGGSVLGVTTGFPISFSIFVVSLFAFFAWTAIFVVWINYYLDVWVVTTDRVFDIEQHALFTRDVSEFRLDKVQDITVEVRGIVPTLLSYGDIHVQTAGKAREFLIRKIPQPYHVRDLIAQEVHKALTKVKNQEAV